MGHYLKCFVGHSSDFDIRYHCASGGMVSQFLIFLLEKEYIDGAVVTAFNAQAPLLVNSYIARTREEVLMAKYPATFSRNRLSTFSYFRNPSIWQGKPTIIYRVPSAFFMSRIA